MTVWPDLPCVNVNFPIWSELCVVATIVCPVSRLFAVVIWFRKVKSHSLWRWANLFALSAPTRGPSSPSAPRWGLLGALMSFISRVKTQQRPPMEFQNPFLLAWQVYKKLAWQLRTDVLMNLINCKIYCLKLAQCLERSSKGITMNLCGFFVVDRVYNTSNACAFTVLTYTPTHAHTLMWFRNAVMLALTCIIISL